MEYKTTKYNLATQIESLAGLSPKAKIKWLQKAKADYKFAVSPCCLKIKMPNCLR